MTNPLNSYKENKSKQLRNHPTLRQDWMQITRGNSVIYSTHWFLVELPELTYKVLQKNHCGFFSLLAMAQ